MRGGLQVAAVGMKRMEGWVHLGIDVAREGDAVVLTPLGVLDLASVPALRQRVIDAVAAGRPHIVLNLSSVDFCDSTGLGALISARKRTLSHGASMAVVCPAGPVRDVVELCGLHLLFTLHDSVAAALADRPAQPDSSGS